MIALLGVVTLVTSACGDDDGGVSEPGTGTTDEVPAGGDEAPTGDPIVIGASLPLTGPLEAFGTSLNTGYQQAVDEVNAAGGLSVGGQQRLIELVVQDNQTSPDLAGEQVRNIVLDDGAVALLGPATPPLSIPVSVVAEQLEVPTVITITPIRAWQGANETGWNWSWDVFFDELQMTQTQFQASDLVEDQQAGRPVHRP